MPSPFDNLTQELARLPGIGRRSAERVALALVRKGDTLMIPLIRALQDMHDTVCVCRLCGSITTRNENPCKLCSAPGRNTSVLCVVEESGDIRSLERSGAFKGIYHTLHGRISPMSGSGPNDIRLAELEKRISSGSFSEVILAISTDVEGDATAAYLSERLAKFNVPLTRLALGLPADSGISFSDPVTLKRAIDGRQKL